MEGQLARVNGAMLQQSLGQNVMVVGKVVDHGHAQSSARFECSDGRVIQMSLPPGESFTSQFAQVVGKVDSAASLQVYRVTPLDDGTDLQNYDKLVQLANSDQLKDMFL